MSPRMGWQLSCPVAFALALAWCVGLASLGSAQPTAAPASAAQAQAEPPVGVDPHAGLADATELPRRPPAEAAPSPEVPAGQIRVRVVDEREAPVASAEVQVGVMSQEGARSTLASRTNESGVTVFGDLMSGERLAYRVNVTHDGAKTSSTPFRLPAGQGYAVSIRRLPTTRQARDIVQYVGATSIELKDDRLKVVQQARLFNVGRAVYVFPSEGLLVPLPAGAMAFQAEELMTDQRLTEQAGRGFVVHGSLAPGEVTLTWGFDLPREGTTAELSFAVPWPTFAYRVLADAADGLQLEVAGMPKAELHDDGGRRYLVAETMRSPGAAPLRSVRIFLRGIPGPGPLRWVALGLALALLVAGAVLSSRRRGALSRSAAAGEARADLAERKAALVSRANALHAERERGEIGPEFYAESLTALEDELAALLYEQARSATAPA